MFPLLFSLNIVNNIPNRIMVGSTVAPHHVIEKIHAMQSCNMM